MMSLFGFANLAKLQGTKDDDWADRVSHLWTVVILAIFTILVSSAQYVGDPIQCWCPAQFTGSYVAYTKNVCWISNTYYIPSADSIPEDITQRQQKQITYYQWVPIIFLFQALLFKLPNVLWRMLNGTGGLNMDKLVQLAENTQLSKSDDRDKIIFQIAKYLDRWLKAHRHYHYNLFVRMRQRVSNVFCFWMAKREGQFLTGFYLFVKLLYLANVLSQFFLLNAFLSMDYTAYGFEVIKALADTGELRDSPRFPRVTLCDFEIRQLTNLQRFTVQCVLPINLFNEKIFIFLWFWYMLVAIVAGGNYAAWLYYVLISHNRYRYVKKYLKITDSIRNAADLKLVKKFSDDYLRDDGVFVLRVVSINSSELVLTDLVTHLWNLFRENPQKVKGKDWMGESVNTAMLRNGDDYDDDDDDDNGDNRGEGGGGGGGREGDVGRKGGGRLGPIFAGKRRKGSRASLRNGQIFTKPTTEMNRAELKEMNENEFEV